MGENRRYYNYTTYKRVAAFCISGVEVYQSNLYRHKCFITNDYISLFSGKENIKIPTISVFSPKERIRKYHFFRTLNQTADPEANKHIPKFSQNLPLYSPKYEKIVVVV